MPEEIENDIGLSRLWFPSFSIMEKICGGFVLLEKVYSSLNGNTANHFSNDVNHKTKLICVRKWLKFKFSIP